MSSDLTEVRLDLEKVQTIGLTFKEIDTVLKVTRTGIDFNPEEEILHSVRKVVITIEAWMDYTVKCHGCASAVVSRCCHECMEVYCEDCLQEDEDCPGCEKKRIALQEEKQQEISDALDSICYTCKQTCRPIAITCSGCKQIFCQSCRNPDELCPGCGGI